MSEEKMRAAQPDETETCDAACEDQHENCPEDEVQEAKIEGNSASTAPEEDENYKFMRLTAEFQNYKKRVEKERSEIYKSASCRIITELLPVLDDFDRIVAHTAESGKDAFSDGIQLVVRRFEDILKKEGLEKIETDGADFDPNYHHAVMIEESDEFESGKIIQEVQKGYKVNGKVIRPSMVKVSK